jgi:hypothetical protein
MAKSKTTRPRVVVQESLPGSTTKLAVENWRLKTVCFHLSLQFTSMDFIQIKATSPVSSSVWPWHVLQNDFFQSPVHSEECSFLGHLKQTFCVGCFTTKPNDMNRAPAPDALDVGGTVWPWLSKELYHCYMAGTPV